MRIKKNIKLKKLTTFRIGGPARFFCVVKSKSDLKKARLFAADNKLRSFALGGGSNVLFMDDGFEGLVMKINNSDLAVIEDGRNSMVIRCGAGVPLAKLVAFASKKGLAGLEWAVGIPGQVGGAIRGNAGAFGGEMKDCLRSVNAINIVDEQHPVFECKHDSCGFSYRESVFKRKAGLVIWDCIIELKKGDRAAIRKNILEFARKRKEKQPPLGKYPSAGSIFKNPDAPREIIEIFQQDKGIECRSEKVPAGWLIECCDLKEKIVGGAMVSKQQANFIVNTGNARAEDVIILISLIKMKVRNEFGIQLEEEIQIVN